MFWAVKIVSGCFWLIWFSQTCSRSFVKKVVFFVGFTLFFDERFFRSLRLLCIVVCCIGLCSIVLVRVNLVRICFLSAMTLSKFLLFQIVPVCFRVCCFLLFKF